MDGRAAEGRYISLPLIMSYADANEDFYAYIWPTVRGILVCFHAIAMKLCFLLLFFRLSGSILFLRVLWAIVTFYIASTLAGWLLYAPLKSFYAPELYPDVRCLSTNM